MLNSLRNARLGIGRSIGIGFFYIMSAAAAEVRISETLTFTGMSDASAGVTLTDDLFVAADDESNRLRTYSRKKPGGPVQQLSLDLFLGVDRKSPETDIEGAARVGDIVYWVTSHARNKDGEYRQSRLRFFATQIHGKQRPRLQVYGIPYAGLLRDLAAAPELKRFDLERASKRAPKDKNALNIEGMCARPDGSVLIAFRNPVPKKDALLVPVLNPAELISKPGARAKFGPPVQLDLGGNGIRDIVQDGGTYYLIAGAHNGADRFQLHSWDGNASPKLLHSWEKGSFNPEAILSVPGRAGEFLILSDEGAKTVFGRPRKELPEANRRFRSVLITLPE